MAKKLLRNTQGFVLTFDEMFKLYKQNALQLGVNNAIAARISGNLKVKGNVSAAFHLFNWIAVAIAFYGIYLSFTKHWWFFIVGLFITSIIWKANKEGNAENVVNAAISNSELYNTVLAMNGWMYMIDEDALYEMGYKE